MQKNNGGSAFPCVEYNSNGEVCGGDMGMSLRDYFACKAMAGICVNAGRNQFNFGDPDGIADVAYQIADAMLKERSK